MVSWTLHFWLHAAPSTYGIGTDPTGILDRRPPDYIACRIGKALVAPRQAASKTIPASVAITVTEPAAKNATQSADRIAYTSISSDSYLTNDNGTGNSLGGILICSVT